jgi:signal transduction histidine kinase
MLRSRLYLGLMPLLLLVIGTGGCGIIVCKRLAGTIQTELLARYDASLASARMRADATRMDDALADAQRGDLLGADRAFRAGREAFTKELMAQSAHAARTARAPYVAKVDAAFGPFEALGSRILPAGIPGSLDALTANESSLHGVLVAIDDLDRYDYAAAGAAAAAAQRLSAATVRVMAAAIALAFLASLALAWRLAASLLGPIKALTASAVALGEGDLDRAVPELSRDELGRLGRAFNTMAAKLRAYRDAMAAKVLRTQRTMEATLHSTPDPLFVVSRDGRIEIRNPAAEALAAVPAFAGGFPEMLQARVREVLDTGRHFLPIGYDHVLTVRVGGEDRHFQPRILAIGDALTGFGGAAVLLQDVTRFRLIDEAKTNLVGTVSHELKSPLTSLRMAVYLLLEMNLGDRSARQRDLLETARASADRLLAILNDLLDLARLEGGVAPLSRGDVPVAGLLEEMAREIRPIADARGQRVTVRAAPGLSTVFVDPDRIRHVFINLLSNAAKYSPEGGEIALYAEPADAGFVRFGVRDRGPGIPPESVGRIFEKFYRVPGQAAKGAGLGLAIAREIVVAHGGAIACTSRPGEGSDFHFVIPENTSSLVPAVPDDVPDHVKAERGR